MTAEASRRGPATTSVPGRALLYARTLRYLRARQIADQLRRRLLPAPRVRLPDGVSWRTGIEPYTAFLSPPEPVLGSGEIAFLNAPRPFSPDGPDWNASGMPKLWRYNLHYFDYVHWRAFDDATKAHLLDDWIRRVPPGPGDAWEPYPVSLRIVNWLKYLLRAGPGAQPPRAWLESLAVQLARLERDLEYHLLANHLLKNAKALVLGGLLLEGNSAERWLRIGLRLLADEADEQFLADGGHIERSPMYHCIGLEDLLDVLNVCAGWSGPREEDAWARIGAAARRGTRFLEAIRGGDGEIPLFNDSAFGITAPSASLLDYARRVLGDDALGFGAGMQRICLPASGYFGYRDGGESLIADCGPVGPDYQPGHTHCDTLSYELCLDGRRVIVDSGVFDYEAGPLRHYLRSTAAHNTVALEGVEQSEIWGAFRVARRARPLNAGLSPWQGGALRFHGAHDGFARLPGQVIHEREITMKPAGHWTVTDRLHGHGSVRGANLIHLHPDLQAAREPGGVIMVTAAGVPVLRVEAPGSAIGISSGIYCPEFGKKFTNIALVIELKGRLPLTSGYTLVRESPGPTGAPR